MALPETVTIVEVAPRDGLQNEPEPVALADKLTLIHGLFEAGLGVVEATSFVSPKWVPQLADAGELMAEVQVPEGARLPVLVPNTRGLERALAAGAREIAIFAAASEGFSQKNLNCSIAESLERFAPVCGQALAAGVPVRGYISCVLGCPYEGDVALEAVVEVARALDELGCSEISLGDTIGVGTPDQAGKLVERVAEQLGDVTRIAAHFHDTYGQALANLYAVLQRGVRVIDSAVGGLGGCPYAPGAAGNVATEDVLYMLRGLNIETGVDLERAAAVGQQICNALGRPNGSRAGRALLAKAGCASE